MSEAKDGQVALGGSAGLEPLGASPAAVSKEPLAANPVPGEQTVAAAPAGSQGVPVPSPKATV